MNHQADTLSDGYSTLIAAVIDFSVDFDEVLAVTDAVDAGTSER